MKKDAVDRRTMLAASGAGLGLLMAGLNVAEGADGKKRKKKCKCGKCVACRTLNRATFHHLGVPTQVKHEDEKYLEGGKVYITDPDKDPYHIEWCRWLPESEDPELLRTTTHIAFQVKDVEKEIAKYDEDEVFLAPFTPFEGTKVAFINYEGTLIELLQRDA